MSRRWGLAVLAPGGGRVVLDGDRVVLDGDRVALDGDRVAPGGPPGR